MIEVVTLPMYKLTQEVVILPTSDVKFGQAEL